MLHRHTHNLLESEALKSAKDSLCALIGQAEKASKDKALQVNFVHFGEVQFFHGSLVLA
jgi:hypothetical protein